MSSPTPSRHSRKAPRRVGAARGAEAGQDSGDSTLPGRARRGRQRQSLALREAVEHPRARHAGAASELAPLQEATRMHEASIRKWQARGASWGTRRGDGQAARRLDYAGFAPTPAARFRARQTTAAVRRAPDGTMLTCVAPGCRTPAVATAPPLASTSALGVSCLGCTPGCTKNTCPPFSTAELRREAVREELGARAPGKATRAPATYGSLLSQCPAFRDA